MTGKRKLTLAVTLQEGPWEIGVVQGGKDHCTVTYNAQPVYEGPLGGAQEALGAVIKLIRDCTVYLEKKASDGSDRALLGEL